MGKILRGKNLNVVLDRIYSNCGIQVEKHCTRGLYVCLRKLHITPKKIIGTATIMMAIIHSRRGGYLLYRRLHT